MTTDTTPAVVFDHVSRTHQDGPHTITALSDVSFTVNPGEFVAVMGPSGSGKSTLLNVAGTLDTCDSGTVTINGKNVTAMSAADKAKLRRSYIGFVFQNYNLIPTLTVAENIALPLELDGVSKGHARDEALAALEDIDLRATAERFPAELSGGQRQRVAVARALVGSRSLLLADEPTGALDTATAEDIMTVLRRRVDAGAAAIVVTHEPRFAAWADRCLYLRDGALVTLPDTTP